MRGKNIGGAPVDAAPINRFVTALTKGPDCRLCNILRRVIDRLRFVAASERVIRHFVTDHTNLKVPRGSIAGYAPVSPNGVLAGKAYTGNGS